MEHRKWWAAFNPPSTRGRAGKGPSRKEGGWPAPSAPTGASETPQSEHRPKGKSKGKGRSGRLQVLAAKRQRSSIAFAEDDFVVLRGSVSNYGAHTDVAYGVVTVFAGQKRFGVEVAEGYIGIAIKGKAFSGAVQMLTLETCFTSPGAAKIIASSGTFGTL